MLMSLTLPLHFVLIPHAKLQPDNFSPTTIQELFQIARHVGPKSCSLDLLPSTLFASQFDIFLPVLYNIVNLCLESRHFPRSLKSAVLATLLKPSLIHELLLNFWAISNFKVVSEITEVVASRLNYLGLITLMKRCNPPKNALFHSCETALVRVHNDLLCAVNNRCCVVQPLLDLSAAFDTRL